MSSLFNAFVAQLEGDGRVDLAALNSGFGCASGIVVGTNPPYALADFLSFYPKFGAMANDDNSPPVQTYSGPLPQAVINAYITLASASLMQERWQELWAIAMGLYVAHFCTLYMRAEAGLDASSSVSKIAASGLEKGIQVSKSEGPISASIQLPSVGDGWGAWTETSYGNQLITFAKSIGGGPIWVG